MYLCTAFTCTCPYYHVHVHVHTLQRKDLIYSKECRSIVDIYVYIHLMWFTKWKPNGSQMVYCWLLKGCFSLKSHILFFCICILCLLVVFAHEHVYTCTCIHVIGRVVNLLFPFYQQYIDIYICTWINQNLNWIHWLLICPRLHNSKPDRLTDCLICAYYLICRALERESSNVQSSLCVSSATRI